MYLSIKKKLISLIFVTEIHFFLNILKINVTQNVGLAERSESHFQTKITVEFTSVYVFLEINSVGKTFWKNSLFQHIIVLCS
jgi:hypothetical protein